MLTTPLLLLALSGAPLGAVQEQAETYAELEKAFDKAALDWRRAQRKARKEKQDFSEPHPVTAYLPRFEAMATAGEPGAMLWIGLNAEDLGGSKEETAAKKRGAFQALVGAAADDPELMEAFLRKVDRQAKWLEYDELVELLVPVFEESSADAQREAAALKIARMHERAGTEEDMAQAEAWYQKVIDTFPDSKSAGVAKDQLIGMNVAVGRIAPDFETTDVDGTAFKLSDYRGKVVVIDFWGFW